MSLARFYGRNTSLYREGIDPDPAYVDTATCFYCSKDVKDVGIVWMGATPNIFMHAECTLSLIFRLIRDVQQYELKVRPIVDPELIPGERK